MVSAKMVLMSRNDLYLVKGVNDFPVCSGNLSTRLQPSAKPCVNHKSVKKSLPHAVGR